MRRKRSTRTSQPCSPRRLDRATGSCRPTATGLARGPTGTRTRTPLPSLRILRCHHRRLPRLQSHHISHNLTRRSNSPIPHPRPLPRSSSPPTAPPRLRVRRHPTTPFRCSTTRPIPLMSASTSVSNRSSSRSANSRLRVHHHHPHQWVPSLPRCTTADPPPPYQEGQAAQPEEASRSLTRLLPRRDYMPKQRSWAQKIGRCISRRSRMSERSSRTPIPRRVSSRASWNRAGGSCWQSRSIGRYCVSQTRDLLALCHVNTLAQAPAGARAIALLFAM